MSEEQKFTRAELNELDSMMKSHADVLKERAEAMEAKNAALSNELLEKSTKMEADIAEKMAALQEKDLEASDRISALEQSTASRAPRSEQRGPKTVGQMFVESDAYREVQGTSRRYSDKVEVGSFYDGSPQAAAILNATGQNQPLVPSQKVSGVITEPIRRLRVRDLLAKGRTSSNLIEFPRATITMAAAPQYQASPELFENVVKAEKTITFSLSTAPVRTIAVWIPASKQILDDAPALQSYIDTQLREDLMLEEEDQLLLGDGTGANLNGLVTQATAYDTALNQTGDTRVDRLRRAILQVFNSNYAASGMVVHPTDWAVIQTLKVNP